MALTVVPVNIMNGHGGGPLRTADDSAPPPLASSFSQRIRPLLDAVDKVRSLGIKEEGIQLPTIVVVGDQSSGKSSVLESLSGVQLPKGDGIVTRVPLILRLKKTERQIVQYDSTGEEEEEDISGSKVTIAYEGRTEEINEEDITSVLSKATEQLAGRGKGIVDKPITLTVARAGAPDLTLVDLPGITRVAVRDQPEDIYERVRDLIMKYISPAESIILNVLSAAMDFPVAESIRMSRHVDPHGVRTLAVVTKVDLCPDGLRTRIADNAVKIGLGYVCVRNRTAKDATIGAAARAEEALFGSHPELKELPTAMLGVSALANRLVQLQSVSICRVIPVILRDVENCLEKKQLELAKISGGAGCAASPKDAAVAFFRISTAMKETVEAVLSGTADADISFNYTAALHSKFCAFSRHLIVESGTEMVNKAEVGAVSSSIEASRGTNLPNLVTQNVIETMIRKQVDRVRHHCCVELPEAVHGLGARVAAEVALLHVQHFPKLKLIYLETFGKTLMECKLKAKQRIQRQLDMEKAVVYTCSSAYSEMLGKLKAEFGLRRSYGEEKMKVAGLEFGLEVKVLNSLEESVREAVFSGVAYWDLLGRRLAEQVARDLRYCFGEAMLAAVEEVVGIVIGGGGGKRYSVMETMEENAEIVEARVRLSHSVNVLSECRTVIQNALHEAQSYGCV